eukprot:scaffold3202_cov407-Prasinococcus_capsulatus_cf.AAC.2
MAMNQLHIVVQESDSCCYCLTGANRPLRQRCVGETNRTGPNISSASYGLGDDIDHRRRLAPGQALLAFHPVQELEHVRVSNLPQALETVARGVQVRI